MTDPAFARAAKIATVHQRLGEAYGLPVWSPPDEPPIDELVHSFLGQNTSDVNSGRAYAALKAAYRDWQAVMDAPLDEFTAVIRSCGLANRKAPRIQKALRTLQAGRGDFDLSWLAGLPVNEARAWLTGLDGIGNKSASILLLFSFNRPAFPVDTHVGRVTVRLGLAPTQASPDKIMGMFEAHAPAAWYYPLHLNLIRHGRQVCQARQPRCGACVLRDICDYGRTTAMNYRQSSGSTRRRLPEI